MSIYDAITNAADHIERHPKNYDFHNPLVPTNLGGTSCLLGWIAYFAGEKPGVFCGSVECQKLLGMDFMELLLLLATLEPGDVGSCYVYAGTVVPVLRRLARELAGRDPKPTPSWYIWEPRYDKEAA